MLEVPTPGSLRNSSHVRSVRVSLSLLRAEQGSTEATCVFEKIKRCDFRCLHAQGGTRTRTPCGATPSRWCVYQFHHLGLLSKLIPPAGAGLATVFVARARRRSLLLGR